MSCVLNPLAPGSSPGWPTRNGASLPIRRTLAARWLRCLLTHSSALRELLATDPPSHDASKPICHFCLWLLGPQSLAAGALGSGWKYLRAVGAGRGRGVVSLAERLLRQCDRRSRQARRLGLRARGSQTTPVRTSAERGGPRPARERPRTARLPWYARRGHRIRRALLSQLTDQGRGPRAPSRRPTHVDRDQEKDRPNQGPSHASRVDRPGQRASARSLFWGQAPPPRGV